MKLQMITAFTSMSNIQYVHIMLYFSVFNILQISNDPETLAKMPPVRNGPRLVELTVVDGVNTYFLFVEQTVLCSVKSFTKALFLWFALHYICNLEYEKCVEEVGLFFQEFVFGLPCQSSKKTSTYLTTTTDIQKLTIK